MDIIMDLCVFIRSSQSLGVLWLDVPKLVVTSPEYIWLLNYRVFLLASHIHGVYIDFSSTGCFRWLLNYWMIRLTSKP